MTVSVASPPVIGNEAASLARKRRREILISQRTAAAAAAVAPTLTPTSSAAAATAGTPEATSTSSIPIVTTSEPVELVPPVTTSSVSSPLMDSGTSSGAHMIPDFASSTVADMSVPEPANKKMKMTTSSTGGKPKKPQMKYDPDVPMTKEEAAVWRREQRRKRNRESAAASRQRQRDRIAELEVEVDEWKEKYAAIMSKLAEMEEVTQQSLTDDLIDSLPNLVSQRSAESETDTCGVKNTLFLDFSSTTGRVSDSESDNEDSSSSNHHQQGNSSDSESLSELHQGKQESLSSTESSHRSLKMISRPAVKIAGDADTRALTPDSEDAEVLTAATALVKQDSDEEEMMLPVALCPDPCLSTEKKEDEETVTKPETAKKTKTNLPSLLSDGEVETEFDAFLIDAVQWL